MPEKRSDPKDVADMLEALAKRIRSDPLAAGRAGASGEAGSHVIAPSIEPLEEGPSLGALDVFSDRDAITVTVETRNTDAKSVHVSLLEGRLLINLGEGAQAFRRDLPLPAAVDEEAAIATFRNGILDVVLPLRRA
jgi:HSP20 family molecular chaperone IbpA